MPSAAPRVLILQPLASDGPAFLAHWLQQRGQAFTLCQVAEGHTVPTEARDWDAIAMLGGTMSVNDELPFLRRAEALMRDAIGDRKSTRLNSSHIPLSRMPSSA